MQLKCPSCSASFALEAALAVDAARSALVRAMAMPAPLGPLLAQYLGLFRSKGRALAFDRVERLLAELEPLLTAETVERNGNERRCPLATWQQALELVMEHRDSDKLRLPLKSHGYLFEIAYSMADQLGAIAERQQEQDRRKGTAREQGDQQLDRAYAISQVRGDIELGLITPEQGRERLEKRGINPEVLNVR